MRHLMKTRCTVHRPTETKDALKRITQTYAAASLGVPIALGPFSPQLEDTGAGEQSGGTRSGTALPGADIRKFDVLELTWGAESPAMLRVLGATEPRGHHVELVLTPFHGSIE